MNDFHLEGMFDFTPYEEVAPIWITERLCVLFGELPAPKKEGIVSVRLLKDAMFGTGGHPASKLALWSLLELPPPEALKGHHVISEGVRPHEGIPSPFLEIGATTGLLAVVAATTGTEATYHASDNITASCLAEDNGVLNGYEVLSEPLVLALDKEDRANFYSCAATQTGGETVTLECIPEIYDSLKPGGSLIWAGHTADDHQDIRARLEEFFEPLKVNDFLGWPVLVMKKALKPWGKYL